MIVLETQRFKEFKKLHNAKLKTVTIVTINKRKFPKDLFTKEEIEKARRRHRSPEDYKEYLRIARKHEPKVYNGNYCTTLNECGMQDNHTPPTITYYA